MGGKNSFSEPQSPILDDDEHVRRLREIEGGATSFSERDRLSHLHKVKNQGVETKVGDHVLRVHELSKPSPLTLNEIHPPGSVVRGVSNSLSPRSR